MHAGDTRQYAHHLFALLFEKFQVVPEDLERQRTLGASHRFSDVVFDRLGEVPDRPRVLLQGALHGGDQCLFTLMKYWAPLVVRLQVNKIFCITETPGVGSVIRTANLRYNRFHFWEGGENIAGAGRVPLAFRKIRAVRQGATRPYCAFIEMRQKLGTDDSAEVQDRACPQCRHPHADRKCAMSEAPA